MYSSVAGVIHKNFSDVNDIDHSINNINHIGHINDNHNDHNMNANFNNQTTSYIFNDSTTNISNMTELNNHFTTIIYNVVTHALFYSISIIGILGNSLVIYVISSNPKMRTVINLLLLNLAIADLSFALVVPPSTSYYLTMANWPFGSVACKMMHYLVNVTAYVTVYTLVLISVIRFLTVVRGLNTTAWKTRRIVVGLLFGMWLLWLILNIPILIQYDALYKENVLECDYEDEQAGKHIFITFFVFAYVLPLVCIGLLSVGILRHIEKNKPTCGPMLANHRKTRSGIKKRQASRLLILVVVMFALLWLPVQLHLLYSSIYGFPENPCYNVLSILFQALAYCNSCVNPIIYNHTSRDFREAFRQALGRCFCCCPTMRKNYVKNGVTHISAAPGESVSGRRRKDLKEMNNLKTSLKRVNSKDVCEDGVQVRPEVDPINEGADGEIAIERNIENDADRLKPSSDILVAANADEKMRNEVVV